MKAYSDFLTMVSSEFRRYLIENEDFAERLPPNTLVIFQVEGEDAFNAWHEKVSLKNREKNQPIRYVRLKKWRQHSALEDVTLIAATA